MSILGCSLLKQHRNLWLLKPVCTDMHRVIVMTNTVQLTARWSNCPDSNSPWRKHFGCGLSLEPSESLLSETQSTMTQGQGPSSSWPSPLPNDLSPLLSWMASCLSCLKLSCQLHYNNQEKFTIAINWKQVASMKLLLSSVIRVIS